MLTTFNDFCFIIILLLLFVLLLYYYFSLFFFILFFIFIIPIFKQKSQTHPINLKLLLLLKKIYLHIYIL